MYHNTTQVLGDNWRIIHDPDDRGREQAWQNGIPSEGARDCTVPGFAHQSFPYDYGIFWYERRFSLQLVPDDDHVILLRVGAADFLCETYVNGVRIGLHRGPEDPFSYDITSALNPGGENLLVFRVSKPYAENVDGYVFVNSERSLMTGDFVTVKITGSSQYDLIGEIEDEFTE